MVLFSSPDIFREFQREVKTGKVKEVVRDLVISGADEHSFKIGFAEGMSKERQPSTKKIENVIENIKENKAQPTESEDIWSLSDDEFEERYGYGTVEDY